MRLVALLLLPTVMTRPVCAQTARLGAGITTVAPGIVVVADRTGNLLLHVGSERTQVIGIQSPSLAVTARRILDSLHAPKVDLAVAFVGDSTWGDGDGGWAETGAVTVWHENLRYMPHYRPSSRTADTGRVARRALPFASFSEAMQWVTPDNEDIHLVHQKAGFSDADIIAHLERANVLYMGRVLTTDGYPSVETRLGGSFAGLVATVEYFYKYLPTTTFVGSRGPVVDHAGLGRYLSMLTTVRDTVRVLVKSGKTREQVMAGGVARRFDGEWGNGPVSSQKFVAMVVDALLQEEKPKQP